MPGSSLGMNVFMSPSDQPQIVEPDYHIILDNTDYSPSPQPMPPSYLSRRFWQIIMNAAAAGAAITTGQVDATIDAIGTLQAAPNALGPTP